ncbi:MAG: hypothetical protein ACJA1F_003025 [Paracoccaceae bacterium]
MKYLVLSITRFSRYIGYAMLMNYTDLSTGGPMLRSLSVLALVLFVSTPAHAQQAVDENPFAATPVLIPLASLGTAGQQGGGSGSGSGGAVIVEGAEGAATSTVSTN